MACRLADIEARFSRDGPAYLFSLRLLPIVPFALVNAAVGLTRMTTWTFVCIMLACQHKVPARQVLQAVAPEANTHSGLLPARYGEPIPDGIDYPVFVKPVSAASSILARQVDSPGEPRMMTRFGAWER